MVHNKPFVITGSARSGTSLLSAVLSTHPKIVIINEDYDSRIWPDMVYFGDGLVGTKLPMPRLMYDKKSGALKRLIYRKLGIYQYGCYNYTLKELQDRGYPIIVMLRDREETIKSRMRHRGISYKKAGKETDIAIEQIDKLDGDNSFLVSLSYLTQEPESALTNILDFLSYHYDIELKYNESMLEGYQYTPYYSKFYNKITPRE